MQQRPHHPVRPIPSQLWCKNFGKKEYWRSFQLAWSGARCFCLLFVKTCAQIMLDEVLWAYSGMLHVMHFDFFCLSCHEECMLDSNKLVIHKPLIIYLRLMLWMLTWQFGLAHLLLKFLLVCVMIYCYASSSFQRWIYLKSSLICLRTWNTSLLTDGLVWWSGRHWRVVTPPKVASD